ncbi:MAG: hypothetical protein FWD64_07515 [Acidobacteriaceae bacterium]|nr:hypothetical protein [Acidobacteriaceae bacterium]
MSCSNHPEREHTAFCQNCGKPVCTECARSVGTSTYCESCLAARLAGTAPYPGASAGGQSPVLAAILGFIPGVGAMYNGQFVKGIVHIAVFAVLVSLSDYFGIFGLFIAGWVFYQVIEAYYTARALRDGLPLPNPFGLNDLGERLGFGRSWTPGAGPFATPGSAVPSAAPPHPDWTAAPGIYANPYAVPEPPVPATASSRFPSAALWLIGLGVFFFITNEGFFHVSMQRILPILIIALGVWLFLHLMGLSGSSMADDGSACYRVRLANALRGPVWIVLIGLLSLLASFGILSLRRSWPLFLIAGGGMVLLDRWLRNSAAARAAAPPAPEQLDSQEESQP